MKRHVTLAVGEAPARTTDAVLLCSGAQLAIRSVDIQLDNIVRGDTPASDQPRRNPAANRWTGPRTEVFFEAGRESMSATGIGAGNSRILTIRGWQCTSVPYDTCVRPE